MTLPESAIAQFWTMVRAAKEGDLSLVETTDKRSGDPRYVICMVSYKENGNIDMIPLAVQFWEDPVETLTDPAVAGPGDPSP